MYCCNDREPIHKAARLAWQECIRQSPTFELRGHQRQATRVRAEKMYCVPQAGPWWSAVGAPFKGLGRILAGSLQRLRSKAKALIPDRCTQVTEELNGLAERRLFGNLKRIPCGQEP